MRVESREKQPYDMTHALRVFLADTTNPYFNLATEDWIFHDMDPQTTVLFLWRNEPSIIVGRGQNVWSECNLEQVKKDQVHVVRRHSGGGAVYQDLGNTCFTFMGSRDPNRPTKELYSRNNKILIESLADLGIQAQASGRNDIIVEREGQPFKVSGSAFKESRDRCFHHGTMLMDVDLTRLSTYLTPDSQKLKAKGIKSVKSRVLNLTELQPSMDHQSFVSALTERFFAHYGQRCEIERLNETSLKTIETLSNYYEKLKSWDWVYGKTPHFQHTLSERFEWGGCELHLDTSQGVITQAKLYTDSLYPEVISAAAKHLQGQLYTPSGVEEAMRAHMEEQAEHAERLESLYTWISAQL